MAFCVNCGVKLAKSELKCPLCTTPVINPNKQLSDTMEFAYSDKIENLSKKRIDWKYVTKLAITFLIFLTSIAVLCNIVISGKFSWSIYVICSVAYLICQLSFVYFKNIYLALIISLLSDEGFMFVIAYLNNGMQWYLYLILPFILIIMIYVIMCFGIFKRKKKKNLLRNLSICFLWSAGAIMLIETLIDLYNGNGVSLFWSICAALPIAIISITAFIVSYNKKLLEKIKQKIFI